jgi:hypothetical protein
MMEAPLWIEVPPTTPIDDAEIVIPPPAISADPPVASIVSPQPVSARSGEPLLMSRPYPDGGLGLNVSTQLGAGTLVATALALTTIAPRLRIFMKIVG